MTGRYTKRQEAVHDEVCGNLTLLVVATSGDTGRHLATARDGILQSTLKPRGGVANRQWYVKLIKQLGMFRCIQLSPEQARAFCKRDFGFRPTLDKCITFAPNLFIVDPQHPLGNAAAALQDS